MMGTKHDAASQAGRAVGQAIGEALNKLGRIADRREAREDAILEAFRLSDREHSYEEVRDRLFRERGLGTIDE